MLSIKRTGQLAAEEIIKSIERKIQQQFDSQGHLSINAGLGEGRLTKQDLKAAGGLSNICQKSQLPSKPIVDVSRVDDFNMGAEISIVDRMNEVGASNGIISAGTSSVANMVSNAGIWGAVIGSGIEAASQFSAYKDGRLSGSEYVKEISKTGAQFGIKGSAISAVMLNVSAFVSVGSSSIPVTVPVVIALNFGLDKILAPMFAKGEYKETLSTMKFYADTGDAYAEFIGAVGRSSATFSDFLSQYSQQENEYSQIKKEEVILNQKLNASLERLTKRS